VILHSNVSIGADGFGYEPSPDGAGLVKVPHLGTVSLEDDVEIGAGSCVDRGKFGATVVGRGTKIDNLVQIAHNCRIGRGCVIAGQSGFSGSVTVGDGVTIAGGVGVADHVTIGSGATIGARSGLMKDVPAGETHVGYPAYEAGIALRQAAALRKLPDWMQNASRLLKAQEQVDDQ
jgi:UDP-3-O-[3-hydroxymyristoyl] glucosamine N-acyltransferase